MLVAAGGVTGSLRRLPRPIGGQVLVPGRGALPDPSVSLRVLVGEICAVFERARHSLIDQSPALDASLLGVCGGHRGGLRIWGLGLGRRMIPLSIPGAWRSKLNPGLGG